MNWRCAFILVALALAGCARPPQVMLADCGLPLGVQIDITESIFTPGQLVLSKDGQDLAAAGDLDGRDFYAWGPDVYPTGHMFLVFTSEDETGGLYILDTVEYDQDPVRCAFYDLAGLEWTRWLELVVLP